MKNERARERSALSLSLPELELKIAMPSLPSDVLLQSDAELKRRPLVFQSERNKSTSLSHLTFVASLYNVCVSSLIATNLPLFKLVTVISLTV